MPTQPPMTEAGFDALKPEYHRVRMFRVKSRLIPFLRSQTLAPYRWVDATCFAVSPELVVTSCTYTGSAWRMMDASRKEIGATIVAGEGEAGGGAGTSPVTRPL